MKQENRVGKFHLFLLGSLSFVLIWSAIKPHDYFTWFLEVLPALLAVSVLAFTFKKFRFTNLVYAVVWLHCIVLMVGGKYTYAEVPLFDYFKEVFGLARNNYDKVGHFMQGFSPALIAREVFIRQEIVNGKWWTYFLSAAVPLAFSAFYELVEWWISIASGSAGDSFLGTQGYVWDTQTDMFMCFVGSVSSLFLLSEWQNRQMKSLELRP